MSVSLKLPLFYESFTEYRLHHLGELNLRQVRHMNATLATEGTRPSV